MKRILLFLFLSALFLSSCDEMSSGTRIDGNGNVKTETRPAGHFNSIDVGGSIDVYLTQDSVYSVKIETDGNLMEYIQVTNDDDVLRIHPEKGFDPKPSKVIKVYVSAPAFKDIEASGACHVFGQNKITTGGTLSLDLSGSCDADLELNAPKVTAQLSGACNIQLKGETKDLDIEGSGSSGIKSMDLMAENVKVDISGSGNADVYASVKLNIQVSGAGTVRYKGNAAVTQDISGAADIKKVN